MTTMRAVVQDRYGTTAEVRLERVPMPVAGPGEVLVRVRAAGIDAGTWHLTTGKPYLMRVIGLGMRGPKGRIRGLGFAGEVFAVGAGVSGLAPGDTVFGAAGGSLAEYVCAPRSAVVRIPAGLDFERAAAVPVSAVTALQALRAADVSPGARVLVLGAAGGVGHYVVQLAVAAGATVTGVCSGGKAELVRDLGAAEVLDYAETDVLALGRLWDVIVDTAGNRPLGALRGILDSEGALVLVGGEGGGRVLGGLERIAAAGMLNATTRQRLVGLIATDRGEDLAELATLIEAGSLRPVLDTVYPLECTAEAIDHLGAGRARGKVVVTV